MIGERIRGRRQELHLALGDLAEQTGLSTSFLSQVERGLVNPSIESLSTIAEALDVPLFLFFVDDDHEKLVAQQDEYRKLTLPNTRFEYELIWFGPDRSMEVLVGRLQPGTSSTDLPRRHTTKDFRAVEECVYVLHGTLELEVGANTYVLKEGDSAYFDGHMPHRFTALGDGELKLLFSIVPPVLAR